MQFSNIKEVEEEDQQSSHEMSDNKNNFVNLDSFMTSKEENKITSKSISDIIFIKIPDKKFGFFMELVRQLGFEVSEKVEIPEEDKAIVRERIKTGKPEDMIPWKEARKQFNFKDKS
jgi:hypothetical protein